MGDKNIQKKYLSVPTIFEKKEDVVDNDNRFTKVRIWLMHLGQNYNGSIFDKEVVDEALNTLEYIPIVGFIKKNKADEDDFTKHEFIIQKTNDGETEIYIGSAYGVITSMDDNNAHYEERLCDDGIKRTFLVVDGVMWNMFDKSSSIINNDLVKSQSMELDRNQVDGYEDENGIFHFTKISFRASCILGEDYEPAMINSTIETNFTMKDFIENLHDEINSKYTKFSKIQADNNNKGGKNVVEINFTQTVKENMAEISNMIRNHNMVKDRWGEEIPEFYYEDIQDEEVIARESLTGYLYSFKLSFEGDKPIIDFESKTRKKTTYTDYQEESDNDIVVNNYERLLEDIDNKKQIIETEKEKYSKLNTKYEAIKTEYDDIKPKYDKYVEEEQQREMDEINERKNAEFSKYDACFGADDTEYQEIKGKKDELTVEEISNACARLYVKKDFAMKFSQKKNIKQTGVGIVDTGYDSSDNDTFITTSRYGNIPIE